MRECLKDKKVNDTKRNNRTHYIMVTYRRRWIICYSGTKKELQEIVVYTNREKMTLYIATTRAIEGE